MEVVRETSMPDSTVDLDDSKDIISLSSGRNDIWHDSEKQKSFILYCPSADQSSQNLKESNSVPKDDKFTLLISKVHEQEKEKEPCLNNKEKTVIKLEKANEPGLDNMKKTGIGLEFFDDLCPVQLKFDADAVEFSTEELKSYNILKGLTFKWQEEFKPYKSFRSQFQKQGDMRSKNSTIVQSGSQLVFAALLIWGF